MTTRTDDKHQSLRIRLPDGQCFHIVSRKRNPDAPTTGPSADMMVYFKNEDGKESGFISVPLENYHFASGARWFSVSFELYTKGGEVELFVSDDT